jgi:hypothetical protein
MSYMRVQMMATYIHSIETTRSRLHEQSRSLSRVTNIMISTCIVEDALINHNAKAVESDTNTIACASPALHTVVPVLLHTSPNSLPNA